MELLQESATGLARRIRRKEISSRQAVEAHIAQIERVNPALNAVVATRFEAALHEADAADAMLRSALPGELGPFHGVPCTIKECFGLRGMPNSSGLVSRRDQVAESDATAVGRLRNAGAIPLGVTNTSELCMWMESNNYVYGRTNNPYDVERTVGGSSGGEGAIVGAGGSPFGLGSDIGGSIRMPAFFNGVFGHKPSGGLVPGTGQFPMADARARRFLATGPLCRRAEDLMPLLRVLAGPDGLDTGCEARSLGDPERVDLSQLRVSSVRATRRSPVSEELRGAQERVVSALADRGMRVETIELPALENAFEIWSSMLAAASDQPFRALMGNGRRVSPAWELAKWTLGQSDFTAMCSLLAIAEGLTNRFPAYRQRWIDLGLQLKRELHELLGSDGILLLPSYVQTAPRHNQPFRRQLLLRSDFAYNSVLNPMEVPVTQVPLGLSGEGLPLGLQVVAQSGNDHLCIAVALVLEETFGGWSPPASAGFAA